jgi:lysophospholipase L1-like esterase
VFARNLDAIRGIAAAVKAGGATLILLHSCDRADVVPGPNGTYPTVADGDRARLLAVCRELDVPVVNLVDLWRGKPEAPGYFRDWIHPNPAGNRAIAAAVTAAIPDR